MAYTERYVVSGGAGLVDGTSEADAWDWATMLTDMVAGERANIKGDITTAAAEQVWTNNGTASSPMALRGYTTTIGDLTGNRLNRTGPLTDTFPIITCAATGASTNCFTLPSYCEISHLEFKGTAQDAFVVSLNFYSSMFDCKIENASTDADSSCAGAWNKYVTVQNCDFDASASSLTGNQISVHNATWRDCILTNSGGSTGNAAVYIYGRGVIENFQIMDFYKSFHMSSSTTNRVSILNCSVRNCDTFVENEDTDKQLLIVGNVVWGSNAVGSEFHLASAVTPFMMANNAVGNFADADQNMGNWPDINRIALTSDPFTSSTDLTLNDTAGGGADCKGVGLFGSDLGFEKRGV